jgi:hypothetical protein
MLTCSTCCTALRARCRSTRPQQTVAGDTTAAPTVEEAQGKEGEGEEEEAPQGGGGEGGEEGEGGQGEMLRDKAVAAAAEVGVYTQV